MGNVTPFTGPGLRDDLPRYPPLIQLLRVTAATVTGPLAGNVSATPGTGQGTATLYIASTQQGRTDTLLPRDREPCFAVDVSGRGLRPGYHLGRLANSYQSLPVYEVVPLGDLLPGLTSSVLGPLYASLTPEQVDVLDNLSSCQLQVLTQLPMTNIQQLTTALNRTQLTNLVDGLTFTQLNQIATKLTTSKIVATTSAYPQLYQLVNQALTTAQVGVLLNSLTSQQFSTLANLSYSQLQVVGQLSAARLQTLTSLTEAEVATLVGELTLAQLDSALGTLTVAQMKKLTDNVSAEQVRSLMQGLTVSQLGTLLNELTGAQVQSLARYDSTTVDSLADGLSIAALKVLLGVSPLQPAPVLGGQALYPQVPVVVGQPSSVLGYSMQGYAPIVADSTGKLWASIGGTWTQLGGGSSALNWVTVTKSFSDFSDPSNTKDLSVTSLAGGGVVHMVIMYSTATFEGPGLMTFGASLGYSTPFNQIFDSINLASAAPVITNNVGSDLGNGLYTIPGGATTQFTLRGVSAGINLNQLTAGSVTCRFLVSTLP